MTCLTLNAMKQVGAEKTAIASVKVFIMAKMKSVRFARIVSSEKELRLKIKGLKKAVGEYQRVLRMAKKNDSWYAHIMYDENTNRIWTDVHYSLGHNEYINYHSKSICPVYAWGKVTMASVTDAISRGKDYKYNCYIISDLGA